jgi:hypothetical protein
LSPKQIEGNAKITSRAVYIVWKMPVNLTADAPEPYIYSIGRGVSGLKTSPAENTLQNWTTYSKQSSLHMSYILPKTFVNWNINLIILGMPENN